MEHVRIPHFTFRTAPYRDTLFMSLVEKVSFLTYLFLKDTFILPDRENPALSLELETNRIGAL